MTPPETIILRGPSALLADWQRELARVYAPRRMVLAIADEARDLPAALASKVMVPGGAAYLCRGTSCSAPMTTLAALIGALAR